jgi:hypothetical protein
MHTKFIVRLYHQGLVSAEAKGGQLTQCQMYTYLFPFLGGCTSISMRILSKSMGTVPVVIREESLADPLWVERYFLVDPQWVGVTLHFHTS